MWLDGGTTAFVGAPRRHSERLHIGEERRLDGSPLPPIGRAVKRLVDIVLAAVGLVVSLPLLIIITVAIRRDSPGPVLFRQVRSGVNGKPFTLFKFRSMVHGNDDSRHRSYVADYIRGNARPESGMFKLVDDPRITRLGRLLRRTSLDELPQLWNVLRGDMSLVGPRPPLPHEVALYSEQAWQRLRVKPGLTGPWQVSGRCNLSFDEMVTLDVQYWQRWSPLVDFTILLKTPKTVFTRAGAA